LGRLEGKVAIITGSTAGLGRIVATMFWEEGAKVVVVGRNEEKGKRVVKEIEDQGGDALYVKTDITKASSVENLVRDTVMKYGKIDILHNNAATMFSHMIWETTEEEWDQTIATNLKGVFLCSKYVIPHMIKQGGGSIINTASIWAEVVPSSYAAYCASKGGVVALTKAMAMDCAPYNIRVNAVLPGTIARTPLTEGYLKNAPDPEKMAKFINSLHPLGRMVNPEEVAAAVIFLASDEASFVTGIALPIDGGRMVRDY